MSFQNKNKKEFENVYHKNKFNVYRIAMDYSGSHKESAEEIFQEVFLKLYTHFDTVDEEYMAAWLVTTTKNTAINYMKDGGGFSVASQGFARYRETPWLQHFAGIAIFGVSMEAGGNL